MNLLILLLLQIGFGNGACLPTPVPAYVTNNVNTVVKDQNIGYANAQVNNSLVFRVEGINQQGYTNTMTESVPLVVLSADGCGHWMLFPGGGITNFNGFVAGSLGGHLVTNILARTNASASLMPFSGGVRNASFWLSGVTGLTGIVYTNAFGGSPHFAISPWHVTGNCHNFSTGDIAFMSADNVITVRSVIASSFVSGTTDLCCGILDNDLPAGISPLTVTPANLNSYITATLYGGNFVKRFPAIIEGSDGTVGVMDINFLDCLGCEPPYSSYYTDIFPSSDYVLPAFVPTTPNSGRPVMILVNNQLALNMSVHNGNYAGPSYGRYIVEIQSVMDSLMTDHHPLEPKPVIQTVDLTSFPTYP